MEGTIREVSFIAAGLGRAEHGKARRGAAQTENVLMKNETTTKGQM